MGSYALISSPARLGIVGIPAWCPPNVNYRDSKRSPQFLFFALKEDFIPLVLPLSVSARSLICWSFRIDLLNLKNEKGDWVPELEITEDLWTKMIQATKQTVVSLLLSARILLDHIKSPGYSVDYSPKVCAGLYTFALEEFGKLLYLLECNPVNGSVKVGYAKKFRDHSFKFRKASEALAADCLRIHDGGFLAGEGNFMGGDGNFDVNIQADLQTRLGVFYTDFRPDGMNVEMVPEVDIPLLEKATVKFSQIVELTKV